MGRNEIEKLLMEMTEDYKEQYALAEKYVAQHTDDLKERFRYAGYMEKPIKKNQIVFWNGNQCSFDGIPKSVFAYIYGKFGNEYSYIWVIKNEKDKSAELPLEVECVKKNTPEYWKALAVSGYLIGDGNLPVPFIKRQEQVYFNVKRNKDEAGIDAESLYKKELAKADYLLECTNEDAISEETIRNTAEGIFGKTTPAQNENTGKKKILFLVNWKEEREHRCLIKAMLHSADRTKYDVTVISPRMNSHALEADLGTLPSDVKKFIYRGRMTVTEKDFILFRILEKHPEIYVKYEAARDFADALMEAEWRRIWGEQNFDCVVCAGKLTVQQYFMACALRCREKLLVDMDFLSTLKEREPKRWETAVSVFSRIYIPSGRENANRYEKENLPVIQRLPVFFCKEDESAAFADTVQTEGREYLVCDKWKGDNNRICVKLVLLPEKGSCLVNTDRIPDCGRMDYLKQALGEKKVYLLGENSDYYRSFLKNSIILDKYVREYLPIMQSGKIFYERFSAYYGDSTLEYDVMNEICSHYGIKILQNEE